MIKPKLTVFYQSNQQIGYGHRYRCIELMRAAKERGFVVQGLANTKDIPEVKLIDIYNYKDKIFLYGRIKRWLKLQQADIIIIDLPVKPPPELLQLCSEMHVKIVNLNGPGWAESNGLAADQAWADFVWVQDTPQNIILRHDLQHMLHEPEPNRWFVFGGSSDPLNLLETFDKTITRDPAYLVGSDLREPFVPKSKTHAYIQSAGSEIWQYMRKASKACVSFGVCSWELATIGVPQYMFARSPEHLHYAQRLEAYGLGLAYPEVGIPDAQNMLAFFRKPMLLNTENKPDCRGAYRLLSAIERI